MKKVKGLFLAALAAAAMFTSCGGDEDALAPEITFPNGGDKTETLKVGDTISFQVDVKAGDAKVEETGINVSMTLDSVPSVLTGVVKTESTDGYKVMVSYKFIKAGKYVFTVDAMDKDDLSATPKTKTVIVEGAAVLPVALTSKTGGTLGGQTNTAGSCYSVSNDKITKFDAAASISATIDFVYYFGATNKATICAPNDATVDGSATSALDCSKWATKNATKFVVATGVDFEKATDADIKDLNISESKVNQLEVGTVVAYKTAAGLTGLFKVTALTADKTGAVTISVKVK
jgi:hypothetical protein